MRIRNAFLAIAPIALFACVPVDPVVSDYNGASVKIILPPVATPEQTTAMNAEATRICKAGGKRRAEGVSKRELPDYRIEYLFLCLS